MVNIIKFLATSLLLTLAYNCNQATLIDIRSKSEKPTDSNKTLSYILGYYEIGETKEAICPEGKITRIEIKRNTLDTIIHILVGGILTIRTQEIYCE